MTRKGPTSVEWLTPGATKEFGVASAMLQPPRAIPIPPQPKLQPSLHTASPDYRGVVQMGGGAVAHCTAPASPKPMPAMPPAITTLSVRAVIPLPNPVPQQALPTPETQQPAAKVRSRPLPQVPRYSPTGSSLEVSRRPSPPRPRSASGLK